MNVSPADSGDIKFNPAPTSGLQCTTYPCYPWLGADGDYTIQAVPKPGSGYVFSHWVTGYTLGQAATVNPNTITVACGGYVYAYFTAPSIKGTVWNDLDGDGIQDGGTETGRSGLTVKLYKSDDTLAGTTTTDAGGAYSFTGIAAGDYYVKFPETAGWLVSPRDQGGNDAIDSDADTSTLKTGVFSWNASDDVDRDCGTYQFAGNVSAATAKTMTETIDGLVVIDVRDNSSYCAGHAPCAVNRAWASGALDFSGLVKTAKTLVMGADGIDSTRASAYLTANGFTDVSNMTDAFSAWTGTTVTCAGSWPVADAGSDKVITEDTLVTLNGSGSSQTGIKSYLWEQVSGPSVTINNANTLSPSFTTPRVDVPVNLVFRLTVTALCGTTAEKEVTVTVTDTGFTAHAKGVVFDDADKDGIRDGGEQGVSGVTVTLYRAVTNDYANQAVTGPDGSWEMSVPVAGDYYVVFTPANERVFSPMDQGGDDSVDSDADPDTGQSAARSFTTDGVDLAIDAGTWVFTSIFTPQEALDATLTRTVPVVIDIRDGVAYCAGHIFCSLNLAWPDAFKAGIGGLGIGLDYDVLIVDADGSLAVKAAAYMASLGFTEVWAMEGGMAAWTGGTQACAEIWPAAAAGADITVTEGSLVNLSGAGSSVQGIMTTAWTQTGGPSVTLTGADGLNPSFYAPKVTGNQLLTFRLFLEAVCGPTADDTVTVAVLDTGFAGTVRGKAWIDASKNGIQDGGEAGLANVSVKLYEASCDCYTGMTTTGADGSYQFGVTKAADWYVKFTPPAGYVFSLKDQGGDETDSDTDRGTGVTDSVNLSTDGGGVALDSGLSLFSGNVTPAEAKALVDTKRNLVVLDVRETDTEFCAAGGHIHCAANQPWTSGYLAAHYAELDPNAEMLVTCAVGGRSTQAVNFLLAKGFTNLYNMVPGMNDWIAAGYPTVKCADAFPAANSGVDQSVGEASVVTLDGSLSSTAGFAEYTWTQVAGPAVGLSDAHAMNPSFTAPLVNNATDLVFDLTVSAKCGSSATDQVTVTVNDLGFNVAVSGYVWNDPDTDGYQDPAETGIDGVTVRLYDASCDCQAAQATTAGGGFYQMAVPSPGNYYASFTPPAGYLFTPKDSNVDTLDSDADPALGKTDILALSTDGVNQDWDAGFYAFPGNVTTAQALDMLKNKPDLVIVDVRENATEFCEAGGHIYCAVNYPWTSGYLAANYGQLDPSAETLVVCAVGGRSTQAVNFLAAKGFTNLYNLSTGMNGWTAAAYPVTVCGQPFPVSDAGGDQVMEEGRTVTIGGPNTSRLAGFFDYAWTQTAGPAVALSDAGAMTATFVAPKVAGPTDLVFSLRAHTGNCEAATTDTLTITVGDNGLDEALYPGSDVTFKTYDGASGLGIQGSIGSLVALAPVDPATIAATAGRPETLPYGLVSLVVKTTVGGTARFIIILPAAAPANAGWYKYGATGWKNLVASGAAVFDSTRTKVTITITDGGADDADGLANGFVADPSGLGTVSQGGGGDDGDGDSSGGESGGGGGCFISVVKPSSARGMGALVLSLLAMILVLAVTPKRR